MRESSEWSHRSMLMMTIVKWIPVGKRCSSSRAVTTDMIGPIISQTVADAYNSIVEHSASRKTLSDPKKNIEDW